MLSWVRTAHCSDTIPFCLTLRVSVEKLRDSWDENVLVRYVSCMIHTEQTVLWEMAYSMYPITYILLLLFACDLT